MAITSMRHDGRWLITALAAAGIAIPLCPRVLADDPPPPPVLSGSVATDGTTPPTGWYPNDSGGGYHEHLMSYEVNGLSPKPTPADPLGYDLAAPFRGETYNSAAPQTFSVVSRLPGKRFINGNEAGYFLMSPYFTPDRQIMCDDGSCDPSSMDVVLYGRFGNVKGSITLTDGTPPWEDFTIRAHALGDIPSNGGRLFEDQLAFTNLVTVPLTPGRAYDFAAGRILEHEGGAYGCEDPGTSCAGIPLDPANNWALPVLGDGGAQQGDPLLISNVAGSFQWQISATAQVSGVGQTQTTTVTSSTASVVDFTVRPEDLNDGSGPNGTGNPNDRPPLGGGRSCDGGGAAPHPVSLFTGNVFLDETDVTLPGLINDLAFTRSYNSFSGPAGVLGTGWRHAFEMQVKELSNDVIQVRESTGVASYYTTGSAHMEGPGIFGPFGAANPTDRISRTSGGGYLRSYRTGETEEFSASGKLISKTDRVGRSTALTYDSNGHLTDILSPEGRHLVLEYFPGTSLLQRLKGPDGVIAEFDYVTYGYPQLSEVRYADGTGYRYEYDALGNLTVRRNRAGLILDRHGYRPGTHVAVWSELAGGQEHRAFTYEPDKTTVTDSMGNVSVFEIETKASRKFVHKLTGCGFCGSSIGTQIWDHDDDGHVTRHVDADGKATVYTYGGANLASVTNALSETTTYGNYDDRGRPGAITVPGYGTTVITYAPEGMQSVQRPGGSTTTFGYTSNALTSITTGSVSFAYQWNQHGEMVSSTDSRGKISSYAYDASGRVRSITDPNGKATTFTYDAVGRLAAATRPDGKKTVYTYDASGRLASATDAAGATTSYTYDNFNRVQSVIDPLSAQTHFGYDLLSNLTSLADAKSQVTQFQYDSVGRLTKTIDPLQSFEQYVYTDGGRLHTRTDRKNVTTTYAYDNLGRLLSETFSDETPSVSFSCDDAQRTVTAANGTDTLTWIYDTAGRLVSEASAKNGTTVSYAYNDAGQKASVSLNGDLVAAYTYEGAYLKTITSEGRTFTYEYDDMGRRTSLAFPNGVTTTYSYNPTLGWLERIATTKGATTIADFTYTHDLVGNRLTKSTPDWTETYSYDAGSRLTGAERVGSAPESLLFGYDPVGNRSSDQLNGVSRSYSYDARNRLLAAHAGSTLHVQGRTSEPAQVTVGGQSAQMLPGNGFSAEVTAAPGTNAIAVRAADNSGNVRTNTYNVGAAGDASYAYDANGNLTQKVEGGATWIYEWNALNELTRVTKDGGEVVRFAYDPIGRRVEKAAGGITTSYLYDGMELMRETRDNEGPSAYLHGPDVDQPLARISGAGAFSFYHADGLGSIVATSDQAGAVTSAVQYDAWGNVEQGAASPYAFASYQWDPEASLYYLRARYYNPTSGRFISEDPIRFAGGMNFYAYVGSGPTNGTDPSGLTGPPWHPGPPLRSPWFPTSRPHGPVECFLLGVRNGGLVGAAVVAAAAGAGALGAPTAVITGALGVGATVGGATTIVNTVSNVRSGNYNGLAQTLGTVVGGALVGGSGSKLVPGVDPNAPWTFSGGKGYDPNLGTFGDWLGTGPDKASATGAVAAASGATSQCGCE